MKKIRGKRVRKYLTNGTKSSDRGRPMKDSACLKPSRGMINHHLRQLHATSNFQEPTDSIVADLENLPLELLQHVFFLSLEVNLLKTSQSLRQALSNNQNHRILLLFAYFEEDFEDQKVEARYFLPAEYRQININEKLRLQIEVWKCDWCTPELFLSCMPTLWHLKFIQVHRFYFGKDPPPLSTPCTPTEKYDEYQAWLFAYATWWKPVHCTNPLFTPVIISPIHVIPREDYSVVGARHFPRKLLCPDYETYDQLCCLQLLRQGASALRKHVVMDVSANKVFDGMRNAVEEASLWGLTILLEIHSYYFREDGFEMPDPQNPTMAPISRHPIPLDVFHLACRQRLSSALLTLLIRGGLDFIPRDDSLLTAWAVRHAEGKSNDVAQALLQYMEEGSIIQDAYPFKFGRHDGQYFNEWRHAHGFFASELHYYRFFNDTFPEAPDGARCG